MENRICNFSFPTTTVFGPGALDELPARLQQLGVRRPAIVTDPGVLKTEAFQALRRVLGTAGENGDWHVFSEVQPNPTEANVTAAARAYREWGCDAVIAIGGGSALDTGKAARLLIKEPELKLGGFDGSRSWEGLPTLICIPTTAGTGSEVGRSSVITLDATGRKTVIFHPQLLAVLVILDPELTLGLPPGLTAATGLDALTHCIESFTSPAYHPLCDGIALEGIHLVVRSLPKAYREPSNLEARGDMLVAAAMGAVAFQKDLGAAHSMAHPLSTVCGMHHGTANAVCLPAVMRFNAQRRTGLYRRVGIAAGLDVVRASDAEADRATIEFIAKFIADLGIKTTLSSYGVTPGQVTELAAQASEDSCHRTNPVPVSQGDFAVLFKALL